MRTLRVTLFALTPLTSLITLLTTSLITFPALAVGPNNALNDTGIVFCGAYPAGNNAPCLETDPVGQDADFGRDAAAARGVLTKIGGGNAGFDFTALDASGNPTTPSTGASPHACVRDNVTGLIWEVKTDDGGLRDKDWAYSWYNSTGVNDGGAAGYADNVDTCFNSSRCDTEKYVADVNALGLCGYRDWRMPSRNELLSIVDNQRENPSIDGVYFPNTTNSYFWTGSPYADGMGNAWYVRFNYGYANSYDRYRGFQVRLVRGEP